MIDHLLPLRPSLPPGTPAPRLEPAVPGRDTGPGVRHNRAADAMEPLCIS